MTRATADNRQPSAEQVLIPHSLIEKYEQNKPASRDKQRLGSRGDGTHEL